MEYMDLLLPTAPSLVFARETCTPYFSMWYSLRYPGSLSWQHFNAPQLCLGNEWAAVVTARAALPQTRVETVIGSQAEFLK